MEKKNKESPSPKLLPPSLHLCVCLSGFCVCAHLYVYACMCLCMCAYMNVYVGKIV